MHFALVSDWIRQRTPPWPKLKFEASKSRSSCLSLLSPGIIDVYHHAQLQSRLNFSVTNMKQELQEKETETEDSPKSVRF